MLKFIRYTPKSLKVLSCYVLFNSSAHSSSMGKYSTSTYTWSIWSFIKNAGPWCVFSIVCLMLSHTFPQVWKSYHPGRTFYDPPLILEIQLNAYLTIPHFAYNVILLDLPLCNYSYQPSASGKILALCPLPRIIMISVFPLQ